MTTPMPEGDRIKATSAVMLSIIDKAAEALLQEADARGVDIPMEVMEALAIPAISFGVRAATEHYAQYPEHLALAGWATCLVCSETVSSWSISYDEKGVLKVGEPCGHRQP